MHSPITLYVNGRLHVPPGSPPAEALAVRDGTIVWVGTTAEARDIASGATTHDLGGAAVWPGLVDSHIHLLWTGLGLEEIALDGAPSLAAAVALAGERAQAIQPGGWVRGGGWNYNAWPEGRWPTAADLDRVAPALPVALASKDRHSLWVNSAALAVAGITAQTTDPPGGEIVRDEHGTPTGVLKENAQALVHDAIPAPTREQTLQAIRAAQRLAHHFGLVGVHTVEGADALAALQQLHAGGELRLRVLASIPSWSLDHALALGLRSGTGDAWLRVGGVKIFTDGALGSQTAAMLAPYEGSNSRGMLIHHPDALEEMAVRAMSGGLSLTVHAIGDAANRLTLDTFAAARRHLSATWDGAPGVPPWPLLPNRVEHAQLLHRSDIDRFASLGAVASMQPIHCISDRDTADRYWGERASGAYAFRRLLDAGTTLAFGSDSPVESANPFWGIWAATTRRRLDRDEEPWYPDQVLTLSEALAAYTVGAAIASGEGERRGRLATAMPADFIILPAGLDTADLEALAQTTPQATIVGGDVVFGELET
ncbi:MAG: amidohydrolase [Chloroflexota bacterium]